ncbi:hypothetical protein ALT1644_580011 [Alteromonas macleodii]
MLAIAWRFKSAHWYHLLLFEVDTETDFLVGFFASGRKFLLRTILEQLLLRCSSLY